MNEGINKEPLSNSLGEKMWDSRYEATSQKNQMTMLAKKQARNQGTLSITFLPL